MEVGTEVWMRDKDGDAAWLAGTVHKKVTLPYLDKLTQNFSCNFCSSSSRREIALRFVST